MFHANVESRKVCSTVSNAADKANMTIGQRRSPLGRELTAIHHFVRLQQRFQLSARQNVIQ